MLIKERDNIDNLLLIKTISCGKDSSVHKVYDSLLEKYLIMKVNDYKCEGNIYEIIDNKCDNILHVIDTFLYKDKSYILFDYNENIMDLVDYTSFLYGNVDKDFNMCYKVIMNIFLDISNAVKFIHNKNILHLDIKPDNILVDTKTKKGYLTDFGLSIIYEPELGFKSKNFIGTLTYMSPEIFGKDKIGYYSDIFSLGATIFMVFNNKYYIKNPNDYLTSPLHNLSFNNKLGKINKRFPSDSIEINKLLIDLYSSMIIKDYQYRINISEVIFKIKRQLQIFSSF